MKRMLDPDSDPARATPETLTAVSLANRVLNRQALRGSQFVVDQIEAGHPGDASLS